MRNNDPNLKNRNIKTLSASLVADIVINKTVTAINKTRIKKMILIVSICCEILVT